MKNKETMKKQKVIILVNSLEMGGAERVLSEIAPELSKNNPVEILTLKKGSFYDIKTKYSSLSNHSSNLLMMLLIPYYVYKLKKISKEAKIISFLEISNFINILANKEAIISLRISLNFFIGAKGKIYLFLIKKLYPKAKLIIVNSEENKEDLSKYLNISEEKIQVIRNPVVEENIIDRKKRKTSNPRLISVGRLNEQKNYPVLINGIKKITKNMNTLKIIGEGPERKRLETQIKSLSLEKKIFLLGAQKNVNSLLKDSDYFILSSRSEGFPNVALEAMTAGLPLILSDFKTGARELIDPNLPFDKKVEYPYFGPNGVLLSQDNFDNDLEKAWSNRQKIIQKRKNIEKFYKKNVVKEWEKIIAAQLK